MRQLFFATAKRADPTLKNLLTKHLRYNKIDDGTYALKEEKNLKESGAYVIGITDCGESVCAASGRISTQKGTALEIFERSHDKEKNANLISKVIRSGHTSTIEHIFFNLAFENVSVVVEQFMIEFRLASFTVKSRRYVDFSDSGYYIPPFSNDTVAEKYKAHMNSLFELYTKLCNAEIPKEDARFVLPYCFFSNFFCSLNGREMVNVLRAMLYGRGKSIPEIYKIGLSLLEECKKYAPGVFVNFEENNKNYSDLPDFSFDLPNEDGLKPDVELLAFTPDCETLIAKAALIENAMPSAHSIDSILENKENVSKIIDAVFASSRPRALESATFTVRFNNISLSTLTHLARHRMQSLLVPQLCKCNRTSYIIPQSVKDSEFLEEYIAAFEKTAALYDEMNRLGIPAGESVYCLLSGNTIDAVSTMNGRELKLFFELRTCTRAQWEIREKSTKLLFELRKVSPLLFKKFGPSCFSKGKCPEGRLSCGKSAEMNDFFSK